MPDISIFEERIEDVNEPAARAKTPAIQATGQDWKYSTDYRFPYSSCEQHLSCVAPGMGLADTQGVELLHVLVDLRGQSAKFVHAHQ